MTEGTAPVTGRLTLESALGRANGRGHDMAHENFDDPDRDRRVLTRTCKHCGMVVWMAIGRGTVGGNAHLADCGGATRSGLPRKSRGRRKVAALVGQ